MPSYTSLTLQCRLESGTLLSLMLVSDGNLEHGRCDVLPRHSNKGAAGQGKFEPATSVHCPLVVWRAHD